MRTIIATEQPGIGDNPSFVMTPGALKFDEDKDYPILWNFEVERVECYLGKATQLRREDDGDITAEIELNDSPMALDVKPLLGLQEGETENEFLTRDLIGFYAKSNEVEYGEAPEGADYKLVTSTTLLCVGAVAIPGIPKRWLNDEEK